MCSLDEIALNQSHALTGEAAENDETNFLCLFMSLSMLPFAD